VSDLDPELAEVIRASPLVVSADRYAYLRGTTRPTSSHFLVAEDGDEVTVVTTEASVAQVPHESFEGWFRLVEIRVSVPFKAVGFLATIARAIADRGLNVLVVSTFSKDYVLVRDESADAALDALRALGFPVSVQQDPA
jgi:hypothetical protein